ncbi:MAG: hypothetical protein LBU87_05340 [Lactobacillales bacterium]|jgi:predicted PurR-regulated permease PerM|nr:hypothetical protein [Lactobacillales bacterium]
MIKEKTPFKKKKNTLGKRAKVICFGLIYHLPITVLVIGAYWYLKKMIPGFVAGYFNLETAQKTSQALAGYTKILKSDLSFSSPSSVMKYMDALASSSMANAKTGVLETTVSMASSLSTGLLNLAAFVALLYIVLNFIRYYREQVKQNALVCNITNELLPMLKEINDNLKILIDKR